MMQQKTKHPVQFETPEQTRDAISNWVTYASLSSEVYLFNSRIHHSLHISTKQYTRIVNARAEQIGLDPVDYGTHSLRRTKACLIYRRTKNLHAVQLLLGHTKLKVPSDI